MAAELDLDGCVETQCIHDSHMVSAFCGLGNSSKRNDYSVPNDGPLGKERTEKSLN